MPSSTSLAKAPASKRRSVPNNPAASRPLFWLIIAAVPAITLLILGLIFPEIWSSGALGMLVKGGIFMWPILILGIAAAAVCIERYPPSSRSAPKNCEENPTTQSPQPSKTPSR